MQKKIFLLTLFMGLAGSSLFAQSNDIADEGSVYSKFGLGMPIVYGSPAADGMGLWGVSFIEPYVPGLANPAQWGNTVYTVATGGVNLANYYAEDQSGSAQHSYLNINHFQLVLPVYKGELGVSLSFVPYTSTAYQISESGTRIITDGTAQDTIAFTNQNYGSGGTNRLELGIGWKLNSAISVGYAASLMFASVDNNYLTTFGRGSTYQPVEFTLQTSGTGLGHRFGLYFSLPSVFKDDDHLSIGASLSLPVELNAELEERAQSVTEGSDGDLVTGEKLADGTIQLPAGFMGGFTYAPIPKWSFTAEGLYQGWSNYENTLPSADEAAFTDRIKIGAGIRYYPFVTGSDKFLSSFKYRLGVSYDTGHLKINGNNIETLLFSVGLGYISPISNSSIDISLQYGLRGTKQANLVKENIWRIKLSLNLAELFFFRPKIR